MLNINPHQKNIWRCYWWKIVQNFMLYNFGFTYFYIFFSLFHFFDFIDIF